MGCMISSTARPAQDASFGRTQIKNETKLHIDVWVNGGGPVARVAPGACAHLNLQHVDPKTTRGGCKWSATTSIFRHGQWTAFQISSGSLPTARVSSTVCVDRTHNLEALMAVVTLQQRVRARSRAREQAKAKIRSGAVCRIQSLTRGNIARKPSRCFICMDEMPFAAMTSTVPAAKCHRTCRSCASQWADNAIDEGKLYIRCPGERCTHLMDPSTFATRPALAKYTANLRATHGNRLEGEGDAAFLDFCREHTRMCPACGVLIWRYAGCDHMSCRCGHKFDWKDDEARVGAMAPRAAAAKAAAQTIRAQLVGFRSLPGNEHCFDCGVARPAWTSLALGTVFCIECAGHHRRLGVSRVRSLDLDSFTEEDVALLRRAGGNAGLSSFLESQGFSRAERREAEGEGEGEDPFLISPASPLYVEYRRRIDAMRTELRADRAVMRTEATAADLTFANVPSGPEDHLPPENPALMQHAVDGARARNEARSRATARSSEADERLARAVRTDLEGMDRLLMMGFEQEQARNALERNHGDVGRAAMSLAV